MLISTAYAQSAGSAGAGDGLMQMLPLILIFVVFYFLLIRPQQKRAKEHKQMVENLRRGDNVVVAGGLKGKITRVQDDEVVVEIAEGVKVKAVKESVSVVEVKGEPVKSDSKDDKKDKKEEKKDDKADDAAADDADAGEDGDKKSLFNFKKGE